MDARTSFDGRILRFFSLALRGGWRGSARSLKLLGALAFQRKQAAKRAKAAREGRTVPPILIASVTRRCNLDCVGCYAKVLRPESEAGASAFPRSGAGGELSDEAFFRLFEEALELGVGTLMLAGGEPLLRRELVRRAAGLRGVLVPVFTNGTLLDDEMVGLAARGRIVPVLSIEGQAGATDERRGGGVHGGALRKAEELAKVGALFGFSITLTARNADSVLRRDFLEELGRLGPAVLFLIEYVPVAPGTDALVLEPRQKTALLDEGLFSGLPFGTVKLPGDEEEYGGCLAAGRGFIHLAPEGSLEACPFAPYSDTNAARVGLGAALESPLLKAIRERHAELTETRGGCALWNRAGWVASLGGCALKEEEGAASA